MKIFDCEHKTISVSYITTIWFLTLDIYKSSKALLRTNLNRKAASYVYLPK